MKQAKFILEPQSGSSKNQPRFLLSKSKVLELEDGFLG